MKAALIHARSGATMGEVLIVIAILAMLMAIAIPNALGIKRDLERIRLDETAKTIYVAAQNRMSELSASGEILSLKDGDTKIANAAFVEDFGSTSLNWNDGDYYYIANDNDDAEMTAKMIAFFPPGAIDPAFYNGHFVIEYNEVTGMVYGVFYADEAFVYAPAGAALPRIDRDARMSHAPKLGYYGGADIVVMDVDELEASFSLINDEKSLRAVVTVDPTKTTLSHTLTVDVKDAATAATGRTYTLTPALAGMAAAPNLSYELIDAATGKYTLVLDSHLSSITNSNGATTAVDPTALQFKTLYAADQPTVGRALIPPGSDLTVTLKAEAPDSFPATVSKTANSLFASVSDKAAEGTGMTVDGQTLKTAFIQNARHLQNLNPGNGTYGSGLDYGNAGVPIKAAELIDSIDWAQYGKDGYLQDFTTVGSLLELGGQVCSFNGNGNTIYRLDAPLFYQIGANASVPYVSNLHLVNPKIVVASGAHNGNCAGVLAYSSHAANIRNCYVYAEPEDTNNDGTAEPIGAYTAYLENNGTGETGGLIGQGSLSKISDCYASLTRITSAGNNIGGLLGGSSTSLIRCYAVTGVWDDESDQWAENSGVIITGTGTGAAYATGLVSGDYDAAGSIQNCYAGGIIRIQGSRSSYTLTGLIGNFNATGAANSNCYSFMDFETGTATASVCGIARSGAYGNNCYYLNNGAVNSAWSNGERTYAQMMALFTGSAANPAWSAATASATETYGQEHPVYPFPRLTNLTHYGDWATDEPTTVNGSVALINDEHSLRAVVTIDNVRTTRWKYTFEVKDEGQGADLRAKTFVLSESAISAAAADANIPDNISLTKTTGANGAATLAYTVILDSHAYNAATGDLRFKELFKAATTANAVSYANPALIQGQDVTVTFIANGANAIDAQSTPQTGNSLFASVETRNDTGGGGQLKTAVITNARHLQNLTGNNADPTAATYGSALDFQTTGIRAAELDADIDWSAYAERTAYTFAPLMPLDQTPKTGSIIRFDGNGHSVKGLNGQLFSQFSKSGQTAYLHDLDLVNPKITYSVGSHAGVAGGQMYKTAARNVHVYAVPETRTNVNGDQETAIWPDTARLDITSATAANAGGLFAQCNDGEIDNCSVSLTRLTAAMPPGADRYVGGLVGTISGHAIQDSYADIGLWDPAANDGAGGWHADSGLFVTGYVTNVGGLAGPVGTIQNCYTAGIVRYAGNNAACTLGGLSGANAISAATASYSVMDYALSAVPDKVHGLIGAAINPTACYYLDNAAVGTGANGGSLTGKKTYGAMTQLLTGTSGFSGNAAWTAANAASTYEYGMTAPEGEPVYPFPRLTSQDHYGDWPEAPEVSSGIVQLAGGDYHSLAIDGEGQLYSWGMNGVGQNGDGTNVVEHTPIKAEAASHVQFKYIAAGFVHSLGIDMDGRLWSWGNGASGALGLGSANTTTYWVPQLITVDNGTPGDASDDPKFVKVVGGYDNSVALDEQGNIWTWGYGATNIHGNNSGLNQYTPFKGRTYTNKQGSVVTPVFVDIASFIYDGATSVLALDNDGNIWGWGSNIDGNLGLGHALPQTVPTLIYSVVDGWTDTRGVAVAAGTKMKYIGIGGSWGMGGAMDENGSVYTWGSNEFWGLGTGDTTGSFSNPPGFVYDATNKVWAASSSSSAAAFDQQITGFSDEIVYFRIDHGQGAIIDSAGSLYMWGFNAFGQLGIDSYGPNRAYPTQVYNASTGLFIGGESLPAGTKIVAVTGFEHTLILAENGEVYGTGNDDVYQLGNPTNTGYAQDTFTRITGQLPTAPNAVWGTWDSISNTLSPLSGMSMPEVEEEEPEEEPKEDPAVEPAAPEEIDEPVEEPDGDAADTDGTDDADDGDTPPTDVDDVPELPSDAPTDASEEPTDDTPGVPDDVPELPSDAPTDASEKPTDDMSEAPTGAPEQPFEAPKTSMSAPERPFDESAGSAGILETPGSDTAEGSQTEPIGGGSDQAILNSRQTRKAIRTAARRGLRKTVTRRSGGPDCNASGDAQTRRDEPGGV